MNSRIDWSSTIDVVGNGKGAKRSMNGYGAQSLAIGRALLAGFNISATAWRDSSYDAVLDYQGQLNRVQIKSSQTLQIPFSSGQRGGVQIPKAQRQAKTKVISSAVCDVVIGVQSTTARCWVIPAEVIEILSSSTQKQGIFNASFTKKTNFTKTANAFADFEDSWKLFTLRKYSSKPTVRDDPVLEVVNSRLQRPVDLSLKLRSVNLTTLRKIAKDLKLIPSLTTYSKATLKHDVHWTDQNGKTQIHTIYLHPSHATESDLLALKIWCAIGHSCKC